MFSNMNYVYEVYKEGSFSKAAEKLFISQPALSATVKKVEKKIGTPLFDRSRSPVRLTECGKKYIKIVEKIMEMEEEFAGYVSNLNELSTGSLSVGGTYLFAAYIFPGIFKKFQEMYPNVELRLIEGHTSQLEKKLFSGEIDLIMDNYPLDEELYEKKYVKTEHLLLAVPASFPSNAAAKSWSLSSAEIRSGAHTRKETYGVPLKMFEGDPFVFLREHNDTRERVEGICKRAGVAPKVAWKLDQMLTTYHLTEQGMGVSFISDTAIRYLPPDLNVYYYKLDDPAAERNVYFYYRKNKYFTRSMAEFMKLAASEMEEDRQVFQV